MKSSSWCRGMGLLALVACTLLLFTVTIPSTTVNAATENAVEWNDHITYVDSLENELNQPTSLIEGGSEMDLDSDTDVDSEVELDDSIETELDSDLSDQLSDELEQELDTEAEQDSDADVEDDASDVSMTSHGFMELSDGPAKPPSKFAAAITKVKNLLKALNPFAVKLPPQSPAVVLTPQEHQAKWAAFKAANPKKKYKSAAEEQAAFNTFQANRAKILEQNNAAATKLNPKPFSSKGPFADLPKDKFHSTHLKIRPPTQSTPSAPIKRFTAAVAAVVAAKQSASKHRFSVASMKYDPRNGAGRTVTSAGTSAGSAGTSAGSAGTSAGSAGTSAGSAGTSAGSAGTSAGSAGTSAGSAGTSAGSAGTSAGSAGTSAGSAGTSAGSAGTSAGSAGTSAGSAGTSAGSAGTSAGDAGAPVVAPTPEQLAVAAKFDPYPGPNFNNVADDTLEKRLCRVVSNIWFALYAATPLDRLLEFGVKTFFGFSTNGGGFERFQQNPMLLCNDAGWDPAWDTIHPKQVLIRNAFKELLSHPAGTPFMNPVVATSDQALNQEQCGSCWAQAAVGSLEAALKKVGRLGVTEQLSVQQVIDCVHTKNSNGCAGGTPMDVLDYFKTTAPSLAKDYPYTGVAGECKIKSADPNHRSTGWSFVAPPKGGLNLNWLHPFKSCIAGPCIDQYKYEMDIMFGVKSEGPYIIYVDADQWQHYGGGIYPPAHCSSRSEAGNHVVQLLGYGQQDGTPYWIIKNSWGESWGENGYIKLPMGVNACGMANYVIKASA